MHLPSKGVRLLVAVVTGAMLTIAPLSTGGSFASQAPISSQPASTAQLKKFSTAPKVSISGSGKVGKKLTAHIGSWRHSSISVKIQWKRDNRAIRGADGIKYKLVAADAGSRITVQVTGSKPGYQTAIKKSAAKRISTTAFRSSPKPVLNGISAVGEVLTATAGKWLPTPSTISYRWKRDGQVIPGAKTRTYKLATSDAGHRVSVVVTAKRAKFTTQRVRSAAKQVVAASPENQGVSTPAGSTNAPPAVIKQVHSVAQPTEVPSITPTQPTASTIPPQQASPAATTPTSPSATISAPSTVPLQPAAVESGSDSEVTAPFVVPTLAVPEAISPVARRSLQVGVSLPSYHYSVSDLAAWESATGTKADVLQTFISWEYDGNATLNQFPFWRAREYAARGTTLEVTWVPSNPAEGVDQPDFALDSITAGTYDAYIRQFASDVKRLGTPVRIRLAHEMNGTWQPFFEGNSGNSPGDFVAAWRHVVDVFNEVGASNAEWVWAPNILYSAGPDDLEQFYPGDAYVDLVGIDGYSYKLAGCRSPSQVFDPTLAEIRSFTARPVFIAEVGVSDSCASKTAWIGEFFEWMGKTPIVAGFTWWERAGGGEDFRIVPVRETLNAFRLGVQEQ